MQFNKTNYEVCISLTTTGMCPASARYLAHERPERPPPMIATLLRLVWSTGSSANFLDNAAASRQFCVCFIRGGVGSLKESPLSVMTSLRECRRECAPDMREDVSLLMPVPAGARKAARTVAKHARMALHATACPNPLLQACSAARGILFCACLSVEPVCPRTLFRKNLLKICFF